MSQGAAVQARTTESRCTATTAALEVGVTTPMALSVPRNSSGGVNDRPATPRDSTLLLAPVLDTLSGPVRTQAERTIAKVIQRVKEYDALAAEHAEKQRTYDVNERILSQIKGGPNARTLEASEMRQRQAALDDELQGIETRLAGLTKVLGWPA
jgi:hypothetical protein